MRYTKQAMPLERQMDTLKQRGLIIDDEAAAQQALDTISYFRLADYWFHLEADHRSHAFLPDSHFDEVLSCYHFDKDLKPCFSEPSRLLKWPCARRSSST